MSQTFLDLLRARSRSICEKGTKLISEFSRLLPMDRPGDPIVIVSSKGDHHWVKLPSEGKRIQADLLQEIDRFAELARTISQNLPCGVREHLDGLLNTMRNAVEQEGRTWWKTREDAIGGFRSLGEKLINTFTDYSGDHSDEVLAIADTNALIQNPDIEHWHFDNAEQITIILTPVVLSELDTHKIIHGNEHVREKAQSMIRRIKEYRRRGPLYEGVVIVKDKITLRTIPNEPVMTQSLPWLNPNNADDRLLASTIEVIRTSFDRKVLIVTSDINLQNKAEMAGVPFCEVPTSKIRQEG